MTLVHLINGSGSGIEFPGQMQLNVPGKLIHKASFPQLLMSEHSLISVNNSKIIY
jgi:hypothetical protein